MQDRAAVAVNRRLWAIVNERYTDAAAESMWRRRRCGGLFSVPEAQPASCRRRLDVRDLACGTG